MYEKHVGLIRSAHSQLNCGAFQGWIGKQGAITIKNRRQLLHRVREGYKALSAAILIVADRSVSEVDIVVDEELLARSIGNRELSTIVLEYQIGFV